MCASTPGFIIDPMERLENRAVLIAIGNELLQGQVLDTNSQWLAEQFLSMGIPLEIKLTIADDEKELEKWLGAYVSKVKWIVTTGGLGPTSDDRTKHALAGFLGKGFRKDAPTEAHLGQMARTRGKDPGLYEEQAVVPVGTEVLFNRLGTAPGMRVNAEGSMIFSLPGVPFEMKAMFREQVVSHISLRSGDICRSQTHMLVMGLGETSIALLLKDLETSLPPYLHLAYLPALGYVKLRIDYDHDLDASISGQVMEVKESMRALLGDFFVTDGNVLPEEAVAMALVEKKLYVGVAESCTGGLLMHKLTNVAGSSSYFKGGVVSYSNEMKTGLLGVTKETLRNHDAVSEEVVVEMAVRAQKLLNTDIAVSISGMLGPDGGTEAIPLGTVWLAITDGNRIKTIHKRFFYERAENKELAANAALDLIRLFISGAS